MSRDQKSFDMYLLVTGVLALLALSILVGASFLSDTSETRSAEYVAANVDRIRPAGQVYLPGEETSSGQPQVEEVVPAEPVATVLSGPQAYNEACLMCHGSGIGGAPTLVDKESWSPRIAQGNDTLYQHAIEGYTGESGFMPPKGARLDLSDDEVKGAVDYMIDEVG